mmetsp:Transcript_22897/g.3771  ORF Transcript_22897/g.3771 Transcript_22897/m.3771 type:complete len:119 (+) Transcript_22897:282-638(+)|eukprot:CAMPEP_0168314288 /NCGR_PEP_ID=MMETSP0210-20121227/7071_1 /TAXON_ID=40633 /ORGANISM="Condylostoma magnum, Strain COL2" /LENGTH=118 /DNA_ID=CAMNT_0008280255 /DNA_START=268 /DNA_END=627 /DNA_ORIENTATION=-
MENTNYQFAVQHDKLRQSLDIFAQFFVAPLFNEGSVSREMKAVDSEHSKNVNSDVWRLQEILRFVSKPGNPFSFFRTGNLQTLDQPDIIDKLKQFYQQFYGSNYMALAVLGREDLDTL